MRRVPVLTIAPVLLCRMPLDHFLWWKHTFVIFYQEQLHMNTFSSVRNSSYLEDSFFDPRIQDFPFKLKARSRSYFVYQLSLYFANEGGISFRLIASWQIEHLIPHLSYQFSSFWVLLWQMKQVYPTPSRIRPFGLSLSLLCLLWSSRQPSYAISANPIRVRPASSASAKENSLPCSFSKRAFNSWIFSGESVTNRRLTSMFRPQSSNVIML